MLRKLLALTVTSLLLVSCATPAGQAGTTPRPSAGEPGIERIPVIIDTDMSADDWVAILYLLSHPAAEVRAITVSGTGVAHCEGGVRNALGLVAVTGQPDIPVTCGPETPTDGGNLFPESWRDNADVMYGIDLPENPNPPAEATAPDLLVSLSAELEEKPVLVTLGPLTNIVLAIQADPGFATRIDRIVAMGGAFEVPGNVGDSNPGDLNTVAEWNIYCDPEAADSVVRSGIPITFVPLDATNDVPVRMKFFTALGADQTTPQAQVVYQVLSNVRSPGWYLWDPLAAAATFDEEVVTIEEWQVLVETERGPEYGFTRPVAGGGTPVRVATGANVDHFEELLLEVLNGRY